METRLFGALDLQLRNSNCEENAFELQVTNGCMTSDCPNRPGKGFMANSFTQSGAIAGWSGKAHRVTRVSTSSSLS